MPADVSDFNQHDILTQLLTQFQCHGFGFLGGGEIDTKSSVQRANSSCTSALRRKPWDAALAETPAVLAAGRFVEESPEAHVARVTSPT